MFHHDDDYGNADAYSYGVENKHWKRHGSINPVDQKKEEYSQM